MNVSYKPYKYVKALRLSERTAASKLGRMFAIFLVLGGAGVIGWVFLPILSWQLTRSETKELVTPLALNNQKEKPSEQQEQIAGLILGQSDELTAKPKRQVTVKKLADGFSYFKATKPAKHTNLREFYVTIPTLKITEAKALVNAEEFEKNLGHLGGTALPGEVGNVFITGHSALPSFFSANNYKTIFANLPKLDILDEVTIKAGKNTYTYSVEKRFVVDPSDVSVIDPPDPFGKYLTLMTCVPPGLNTNRLIVLARLVE